MSLETRGILKKWLLRDPTDQEIRQFEIYGYVGGPEVFEDTAESKTTPSLDRHVEQLRQEPKKPQNQKTTFKNEARKNHVFGDSLEKTKTFFADEWDDILRACDDWQDAIERCYIPLQNKSDKNKKGIIIQCVTRFSRKYKRETAWRMQQFSDKMQRGGFRFGLQITLTTDPKMFLCLDDVAESWKLYLDKFMDFMNTRLRRAGKKANSSYLRACELTDSGLLHVHIGLYGRGIAGKIQQKKYNRKTKQYEDFKDWIFPQEDINKLWAKYGIIGGKQNIGTWVNRSPVNEVSDYITKHVAKSWGGDSNSMLEGFLHFSGLRQWSASKGAIPALPPSVEAWECRGLCYGPGSAILERQEMEKEGIKIISDDTIEWERKQQLNINPIGS